MGFNLRQEVEERELSALTMNLNQDPVLKELWGNAEFWEGGGILRQKVWWCA